MSPVNTTPADTDPEVDRLYRSLLMRRSGVERMRMGAAMFDAARTMMEAGVRASAPALCGKELQLAVFARVYARDLDEKIVATVAARVRGAR